MVRKGAFFTFFLVAYCAFGAVWSNPERTVNIRERAATNVLQSAQRWLGVRELTGHNDHPMITSAMKLCGLPGNAGHAWCAASQAEIHETAGLHAPTSARVVDWFKQNVVWKKEWGAVPAFETRGMVGGLYYRNLGRYGHIVLIIGEDKNNYYCYEGNTNLAGSNEGDGFYKTIRPKKSIAVLADYCLSGKRFVDVYDDYLQKAMK